MAGVTTQPSIDLNADVREGLDAADAAILPLITPANIACVGHAGDLRTMRTAVALALENEVGIGAHPGYPEREGCGCREVDVSDTDLIDQEQARRGSRERTERLTATAGELD